jgi:hypothetical protein
MLGTNATKPEYCSRATRTGLTDAFQADDFGTPISSAARRGGRPKGVSLGQPMVPGRIEALFATSIFGFNFDGIMAEDGKASAEIAETFARFTALAIRNEEIKTHSTGDPHSLDAVGYRDPSTCRGILFLPGDNGVQRVFFPAWRRIQSLRQC